jgi:hypothetical protein
MTWPATPECNSPVASGHLCKRSAYYRFGRDSTTVPVDVVPTRNVHRIKGGKPGLVRISGGGHATINVRPRAEPTRASP